MSETPLLSPEFTGVRGRARGQYELEREIGGGGMGIVCLARDRRAAESPS